MPDGFAEFLLIDNLPAIGQRTKEMVAGIPQFIVSRNDDG